MRKLLLAGTVLSLIGALTPALIGGVASAAPSPTISANPSTNLLNGQQITTTGSNFEPSGQVGLVECTSGATSSEDCDLSTLRPRREIVREIHAATV
jgi:hypothetical protein